MPRKPPRRTKSPTKAKSGNAVSPPPAPPATTPRYLDAFTSTLDFVDHAVPYVGTRRRSRWAAGGDALDDNNGAWADLERDEVEEMADGRVRVTFHGGPARAILGRLGVLKAEWEQLAPEARKTIKRYLEVQRELDEAVVAASAITGDGDGGGANVQQRALAFLADVARVVEKRRDSTRGHQLALARARAWSSAQPVLATLTRLLDGIKKNSKVQRRSFKDTAWVAEKVAGVNATLRELPPGYGAACKMKHITQLATASPRAVAIMIARVLHPDVSEDDLARKTPPRVRLAKRARPGDT